MNEREKPVPVVKTETGFLIIHGCFAKVSRHQQNQNPADPDRSKR
jgi:hypothetical protein